MFDPRTLHTREVRQRVIEAFGDLVFDAVINRTVRFPETTVAGEPITTWAPDVQRRRGLPPAGPRGHRPVTLVENDPPLVGRAVRPGPLHRSGCTTSRARSTCCCS